MSDYALELKNNGFNIEVLTENPSFCLPKKIVGNINSKDIKITHSKVWKMTKKNVLGRFLYYTSFMFSSIFHYNKFKNIDIIWVTSPPITVGIAGYVLSKLLRIPYILDVRDLWAESINAFSNVTIPGAVFCIKKIEKFLFSHSIALTGAVPAFKNTFLSMLNKNHPIFILINGIPNNFINYEKTNSVPLPSKLENKFICLFFGNFGLAYEYSFLPKLLNYFEKSNKNIQFLFIGDGVKKEELIKYSKEVSNLTILPPVSREQIKWYMQKSDLCIILILNNSFFRNTFPAKMFEFFAFKKPVILSSTKKAGEMVVKNNMGIYLNNNRSDTWIKAIERIESDPELRKKMGENAFAHVSTHYTKNIIIKDFVKYLKSI